jgi:hypothetical protein
MRSPLERPKPNVHSKRVRRLPKGQGYEILNDAGLVVARAKSHQSALNWLVLMEKFR